MSISFRVTAIAALLAGTSLAVDAAPRNATESRITAISVAGSQPVGTYNGVRYSRTFGTVTGIVDPSEDVVGLAGVKKNAQRQFEYTTEFEIIAPAAGQPANEVIFIDSENRGNAVMLNLINEAGMQGPPMAARFREGLGNGFLQRHATSYARVQWQVKISKDVPETAQGIGLVIMRDFARALGGHTTAPSGYAPAIYQKMILGGKSQSSWFVNSFIAEGFNVEPITGKGIFQGALSVDGIGHWMALNKYAARNNETQHPYIKPDAAPLTRTEMLSRPASDPIFIDTAAYTDFYRLRAGLTSAATTTAKYRRYDIPGPHSQQRPPVTKETFEDCNNGQMVPLNPIFMSPYIRAQVLGLEKAMGVKAAQTGPSLPPSAPFELGPAPTSLANFNPLKGADVKVPRVDANNMPLGGVRFPDAEYPLGKPLPVSLAPVITTSIDNTCGNRGAWQPFTAVELNAKYGSKEKYIALYRTGIQKLVGQGFLLAEDEKAMLDYASYLWDHAENYLVADKQAAR
ncbi:MAG: hypothetical protein EXR00_00105 [Alphaproteobacteria bacterium]|nr:hypothetical protein [Alphaproteobacteria bacterium]